MPKDFAARGSRATTKTKSNKRAPRKTRSKASPAAKVMFHGPSFSFGALIGASIIILAAYAPEYLQSNIASNAPAQTTAPDNAPSKLTFEFPDLLKNSEIEANPADYPVPKSKASVQAPTQWLIQAASFKQPEEADQLRAQLILQDLPVRTEASHVNGTRWFRVMVGPFQRQTDANRALTALRQQQLSAFITQL